MPTSEPRGVLVALVNLLAVTLLCVPRIRTQELPPAPQPHDPFYYPNQQQQLFHVSHQLPDGEEMKAYLTRGTPQKFFFLVERNQMPLDITVTPCASPIEWSLERQPLPPQDFYDEPRVDPFMEQLQRDLDKPLTLGTWAGPRRVTFSQDSAAEGLYVLNLTSTDSDSIVRVLASSAGASSQPAYPRLPREDRQVRVVAAAAGGRTFTVRWPDAAPANARRPVEYCVSVTTVANFRTHCALMAHTHGDQKPAVAKDSAWNFSWESGVARERRRKARPVRPMSPRKLLVHQCVGSQREFTFGKARRGRAYYVDVYVVDRSTHRAEAFEGAQVTMPGEARPERQRVQKIRDGERMTIKLKQDQLPQTLTFEATEPMPTLSVELGVCTGDVPFEVYHDDKLVHSSTVKRWKRVRMKHVLPGVYAFKFPELQRRKSFVSVYVTSRPSELTLPRDMSIKVFEGMTTCHNVTVAWMGTHKKQKYCLYIKEASEIRSLNRHRCSSVSDRPRSERVQCTRYRNRDVSKAVVSATVSSLKPGSRYVVDVYLSRGHSGPVPYQPVHVRTKDGC